MRPTAGASGGNRAWQQWAPLRTAHNPNPPIPLEDGAPCGASVMAVPVRAAAMPVAILTIAATLLGSTLAPLPSEGATWEVPAARVRPAPTWDAPNLLLSTLGTPQTPFASGDWPVPLRARHGLIVEVESVPGVPALGPPPAGDWPVPGRRFPSGPPPTTYSTLLSTTLAQPGAPFASGDWSVPRHGAAALVPPVGDVNLLGSTLAPSAVLPFASGDWPVPRRAVRTLIAEVSSTFGPEAPILPPPPGAWPVPARATAVTTPFMGGSPTSLLQAGAAATAPFPAGIWPVPWRPQATPVDRLTWLFWYMLDDALPPGAIETEVPRPHPAPPVTRLTDVTSLLQSPLAPVAPAQPFAQDDWPVPGRPVPPTFALAWIPTAPPPLLSAPVAAPFVPEPDTWAVPGGRRPALSLITSGLDARVITDVPAVLPQGASVFELPRPRVVVLAASGTDGRVLPATPAPIGASVGEVPPSSRQRIATAHLWIDGRVIIPAVPVMTILMEVPARHQDPPIGTRFFSGLQAVVLNVVPPPLAGPVERTTFYAVSTGDILVLPGGNLLIVPASPKSTV